MALYGVCGSDKITIYCIIFCSLNFCFIMTDAIQDVLHFSKYKGCGCTYNIPEDREEFQVVWDGEAYPGRCSIKFSEQRHRDRNNRYEICAEVTLLDLQCGGPEVVYYNDECELKRLTCNENGTTGKFCDGNLNNINIRLDPYEDDYRQHSSSKLRIIVYRQEKGRLSIVVGIFAVFGSGVAFWSLIFCVYQIKKKIQQTRQEKEENNMDKHKKKMKRKHEQDKPAIGVQAKNKEERCKELKAWKEKEEQISRELPYIFKLIQEAIAYKKAQAVQAGQQNNLPIWTLKGECTRL